MAAGCVSSNPGSLYMYAYFHTNTEEFTDQYITPANYYIWATLIRGLSILQGRTDSSQTTGLVFQDCSVTGTPEYVALFNSDPQGHQAFLGRPWKAFSRTVFIRTYIDQIIDPTGWMQWSGNFALNTLFDAEFGSYGPGANMNSRVTWSSQLTTPQAQAFSVSSFIQGPSWLPPSGIPYSPWPQSNLQRSSQILLQEPLLHPQPDGWSHDLKQRKHDISVTMGWQSSP